MTPSNPIRPQEPTTPIDRPNDDQQVDLIDTPATPEIEDGPHVVNISMSATTFDRVIYAAQGGVIGVGGMSLDIPAGALPFDMAIRVERIPPTLLPADALLGATFGPDTLELQSPATLTIPLVAPWPLTSPPLIVRMETSDPRFAYVAGPAATLNDTRTVATVPVEHFSGAYLAANCHAGVGELLEATWLILGCDSATVLSRIRAKYPDLLPPPGCLTAGPLLSQTDIQAVLDTFFEDVGAYAPDVPIPPDVLARMADAARDNRHVVMLYRATAFGPRNPANYGFYDNVIHSNVLDLIAGEVLVRNAPAALDPALSALQNGSPVLFFPMEQLNDFRTQPTHAVAELARCGQIGCLGYDLRAETTGGALFEEFFAELTPDLQNFNQLEVSFDSRRRARRPLPPENERPTPYGAVRIYIEPVDNVPCARLAGCWEVTLESEDESLTSTRIYEFDAAQQLERMWTIDSVTQHIHEWVRFNRPNSPAWLESLGLGDELERSAVVDVPLEPTHVTMGWNLASADGMFREELLPVSAALTTNQPAEGFATAEGTIVEMTLQLPDTAEPPTYLTTPIRGTLSAERVACPVPDGVMIQTQEEQSGTGPCCGTHDSPGCDEPVCERDVCDLLPQCCTDRWSEDCVAVAQESGFFGPQCSCRTCGTSGDCCSPHLTPGCRQGNCCEFVCLKLPHCCAADGQWDSACVLLANSGAEGEVCGCVSEPLFNIICNNIYLPPGRLGDDIPDTDTRFNGRCEDGGPGAESALTEYGFDCADCGPRLVDEGP